MNIGVVGCGYVGMSVAVNMAKKGFNCICCDVDSKKTNKLNSGKLPFYEYEFDELFSENFCKMKFTLNIKDVIDLCDIIYVAVCTPTDFNGRCNIKYLETAINDINKLSGTPKTVIIKSTCEVGTMNKLCKLVNPNISILFSPEFLAQGQMKQNILNPARIVFGLKNKDEKLIELIKKLYSLEIKNNVNLVITDYETAELAKYACNSFLAMKISFINKISQLCEATGANIYHIEKIMKLDSRIGSNYLQSGIGFGGSCFDKDLKALKAILQDKNINENIISDILDINNEQIDYVLSIINKHKKSNKILILGSTFKKNTSDLTNSPALRLISKLLETGNIVSVFDCIEVDLSSYVYADKINVIKDFKDAISCNDEIVICSDWEQFKELSQFDLKGKNVYDFKQVLINSNINTNVYGLGYKF